MSFVREKMGKHLVITEKPSVARDIVAALGNFEDHDGYWENGEFVVTFAVGHLLELVEPEDLDEKYKRWTLDTLPILPENFPLKPKAGASERLRTIRKLIERDDIHGLVNACDAGREGELIFREITEYLHSDKPIQRLWLQSMTKRAIQEGFEHLQDGRKYEGLSAAAHCRNYSDWLIGMNATRALTRRLKSKSENQAWSAGRVQTPTLAMVVRRELEVLDHRPVPFWRILGQFVHQGVEYGGTWFDPGFRAARAEQDEEEEGADQREDRIFDEERAKQIVARLFGQPALAEETRKPSREAAPPLFDLTSLQREANRRFGWSARRTLNAAQRCYESHKILTYPRTDTRALPNDYRPVVDQVIEALGTLPRFSAASARLKAEGLKNAEKIFDDAKVTDHFAIVPTGVLPERLDGDDQRLFDLVVLRFLAAFHPPAVWSRVERVTVVDHEHFRSRAKILQVPGWREVLGEATDDGSTSQLPPLVPERDEAKDVPVDAKSFDIESDETRPPPRINEARLLSLMENAGRQVEDEEAAYAMRDRGIGTPATRADTIENLISKGYVMRAGRVLRPSTKGIRLIDILGRMRADRLASPALTGELEHLLSNVEHGRSPHATFMSEVYDYTREIVDLAKQFEFEELYPDEKPLGECPLCKRPVYERSWFYRCKEPEGFVRPPKKTAKTKAKSSAKKGAEVQDAEAVKADGPPEVQDCPFRIWKDKSGRYVDRRTVEELLRDGKSRELSGFLTRQGRTYDGVLELVDGEVQLRRTRSEDSGEDQTPGMPEYEVDESPLGTCPTCKTGSIVETRTTFICDSGLKVLRLLGRDDTNLFAIKKREVPEGVEYCPFLLPRTVCKREITRSEAERYLAEGRTELLSDFISQRGRPFSATLFLKETGRHGFEFPPRGGQSQRSGGADEGEGAEAAAKSPRGKSAKKTSRKKKTESKTEAAEALARKEESSGKGGVAKASAQKTSAKKASAKKTSAKKATTRKAATKKATSKKAMAKKGSAQEGDAKKKDSAKKAGTKGARTPSNPRKQTAGKNKKTA